ALWHLACAHLELLEADDECVGRDAEGGCTLEAIQVRAGRSAGPGESDDANETGNETLGTVYAMFTYGAVATSKSPLEDLSQPSRNFRGLRCYTETILAATRQADIAAIFETDLYHARVPTLALHWKKDSDYFPGEGRPDLPKHVEGRHGDIDHHDMRHYIDRLSHLHLNHVDVSKKDPFNLGTQFAYMAWGAYEKQKYWVSHKDVTMEQLIKKHLPHWRLVEHVQQDTLEAVDNLWLVQNSQSLDCLLAFEGTHTFEEFFRNLEGSNGGYCGFSDVHHGYADKLYWLMKLSMPKLRSSLSKCNKVMCTGHSLGGSLCEVFAACANSGRTSDEHYQIQQFSKQTPELMEPIHQKAFSRNVRA
ncbi:Lipase_3 domain-containing protein, partial [Durusdinium trenchii]